MAPPRPISVTLEPVHPQHAGKCVLAAVDVSVHITGLIAEYDIVQRFLNTSEESLEAIVRVPLPDGAVVRSLVVRQGTRSFFAEVREKEKALALYQEAADRGQRAALAEEVRETLMLLKVSALAPQTPVEVHTRIASRLDFDGGEASFCLPTTMTPRYCPPGTPPEEARKISPPFSKGERLYGLSLSLLLDAQAPILEVESDSHLLVKEPLGEEKMRVSLREGEILPDRDILIRWRVKTSLSQPMIASARLKESEPATLLIALPPPGEASDEEILPRHVSFLIDRSGSMGGPPIEAAKRALRGFLRALGPKDVFSIIAFDHQILTFAPRPFTDEALRAADDFIASFGANGGTEILPALNEALRAQVGEEMVRTVVLLTDGSVSNEDAIAQKVSQEANRLGLRAHGIGIGPSVNRNLVRKFARAGRGLCEFIPDIQDLEPVLVRFQAKSGAPLATGLSLDVEGLPVVDFAPRVLGDVDLGSPVVVFARALSEGTGKVVLKARVGGPGGGLLQKTYTLEIPKGVHGNPALPVLWARARIDDLLEAGAASHRDEILKLSLEHQILSPYTALIAVDREDAGTGERPKTLEVPLHMPAGLTLGGGDDAGLFSATNLRRLALGSRPSPKRAKPPMPAAMPMPGAPPPAPLALEPLAREESKPALALDAPAMSQPAPSSAPGKEAQSGSLWSKVKGFFRGGEAAKDAAPSASFAPPPAPLPTPASASASVGAVLSDRERVEAALRFLARSQSAKGAFGDAVTTRLVLDAFAAAGETPQRGAYRRQLARAEKFWQEAGAPQAPSVDAPSREALIAAQARGGNDDGAVLGLGDALVMTALLVLSLTKR